MNFIILLCLFVLGGLTQTIPIGCGNGIVEAGESCDSNQPCCTPWCQFRPMGHLCRPSLGPCDQAEFCDGLSELCGDDHGKESGYICNENQCITCGVSIRSCPESNTSLCPNVSCSVRNGGCDPRVQCIQYRDTVGCEPCPLGTLGNGFLCSTLCGNGTCDQGIGENCVNCPLDCADKTCLQCGDGLCEQAADETNSSCPQDCRSSVEATCISNCNGHGTCNEGLCDCHGIWAGPSCNLNQTQPVEITAHVKSPSVSVESFRPNGNTSFLIDIRNLVEVDHTFKPLRVLPIQNISFNQHAEVESDVTNYFYDAKLDNGAIINIRIEHFHAPSSRKFAGVSTNFSANTIKVSVKVELWPFLALNNSLGIDISSSARNISEKQYTEHQEDGVGNLRWLMVMLDGVLLYGQYLNQAIVDGRNRNITFKLVDSTIVRAYIPHFWYSAEMDPHYNVLLGERKDGRSGEKENKLSSGAIILIVALSISFIILVTLLITVVIPRVRLRWQARKMQKIKEMNTVDTGNYINNL